MKIFTYLIKLLNLFKKDENLIQINANDKVTYIEKELKKMGLTLNDVCHPNPLIFE